MADNTMKRAEPPQKPADKQQAEEKSPTTQTCQPPPITISNCSHHCVHPDCACCKPKKPVTKKVFSKKAAAVLTSAEIDRMIDLGLGRGVDSTDPKPWTNKRAFQVRRVTAESVLGTEEGGSLQSYEREVTSVISHQTDLKASVVVPQAPVEIGIDAEQSRSVSSTRRAVGKKVINRTVSFRSDFSDVPFISGNDQYFLPTPQGDDSVADVQSEYYTFEERLSKWIVKRILQRQELTAHESTMEEPKFVVDKKYGPTDPLSVMSRFIYISNEEEKKKIIHDCYNFVTHFRVTHYVCSIGLGATEYRIFSETDFTSRIGAGGSLAIQKLANLSVSHTTTSRKIKKASDVKTIGKITGEGSVARGTHDEAVVGIQVEPIHQLVKLNYLQLALRRALMHYMEEQGDSSSGPFVIAFGPDKSLRYWTVDEDSYTVCATNNPRNASLFFIVPSDNGKHPHEFHLTYMGDDRRLLKKRVSSLTPTSKKPIQAIPRYLNANVTIFGTNPGPLQLRYHVSCSSQLLLFGRVATDDGPVSPQRWVQGRDMFFINCARRRMKRDGYIAMRRRRRRGQEEWITCCLPYRDNHNDFSIFMLFRLLSPSIRDHKDEESDNTEDVFKDIDSESLDEQLERIGRGTVPVKFRVPPSPVPPRRSKQPATSDDSKGLIDDGSGGDRLTSPESELHHLHSSDPAASSLLGAGEDTTEL